MKREVRLFDELDRFAAGGEITHALALTFGYDGDVAAERIFTPLIQKYGVRHPVVIASGKVDEGTSLGVSVLRAGAMGKTFHPKLFLAVREEAVFVAIGDDAVAQLVVLSPFFEVDDPELDEADSLLRHALAAGIPWAPRAKAPRCILCTGALTDGMSIPRTALEELGSAVELRPQALSVEPRRLHAKVLAILGKKRTTMLWGSPNFTPAALLRSAGDGNVECGLLWTVPASMLDAATLAGELDLEQTFLPHRGPLPAVGSRPPPPLEILRIGEALYDPEHRKLSLHGELIRPGPWTIRVRLDGCGSDAPVLVEQTVVGPGPFSFDHGCGDIEEEDPETGQRRLRSTRILVEAVDEAGTVRDGFRMRLNVRFDDALEVHGNLLLGKAVLSADALLVPSTASPEQRVAQVDAQIARWKAARRGARSEPTRHQASLDAFFRNVRRGVDARFEHLVQRKGSRFALLGWSTDLVRALDAARPEAMDDARRLYLVGRVAAHIVRVVRALPGWHANLAPVRGVLDAGKLAEALEAVPLVQDAVRPELGEDALAMRSGAAAALRRFEREKG
jgi:hypothetical protein